jgi:hypothetical protein
LWLRVVVVVVISVVLAVVPVDLEQALVCL